MEKFENDRIINNESLFRAWVCVPLTALFTVLAMNSGILIFQILFSLAALYFSLSTIAYAASYTNERFEGRTEPHFKNKNLSKAVKSLPLTLFFTFIAVNSITTSSHLVFQVTYILLASVLILSTIAYAAFYTNDWYAESAEH